MTERLKRRRINPLVVMMINLILPMALMFQASWGVHIWLMIFSAGTLLYHGQLKRLVKLITMYFVFVLAYVLALKYNQSFLGILAGFFVMAVNFFPTIIFASILIYDYKSSELMSALQALHLPKVFIIALTITLRYIPTFGKELKIIKNSMNLRGIKADILHPVRTLGFFLTPQLFRCESLSEEITAAGLIKGIDSKDKRSSYYFKRPGLADFVFVLILTAGMVGEKLWEKL